MERHTKVIIALMFVAWFLITASTVIHQEIHSELREHLQHSAHKQEHRLSDAFQELRREEHVLEEKFEEAREFVENKLEETAGQAVLALAELESAGELARFESVRELVVSERHVPPAIGIDEVELGSYDGLTPDAAREVVR